MNAASLLHLVLPPVLFVGGWVLWTFAEYVLHRFWMHEAGGSNYASREHLAHHARSGWSVSKSSWLSWLGIGIVAGAALFPLGWMAAGVPGGFALGLGWCVGYAFYECMHAAAHLRPPPRTGYGCWLRKSHFHHHFSASMRNHGVTTSVWDRVFDTHDEPEIVRVPRRMAMAWLLDDDGEVRPELAADYAVVGRRPVGEMHAVSSPCS